MYRSRQWHLRSGAVLLAASASALGHGTDGVPTLATAWTLSPWLLLPLAALAMGYGVGLFRLWHRAGPGRGVSGIGAAAFALALVLLVLALVWPLDAFGEWSLAAHMAQHMLLLALVPPLLLAGRPLAVQAAWWPRIWLQRLHRGTARPQAWLVASLAAAAIAHGAVMLLWHLPAVTALALADESVHYLMHASFLLAGLWFWASLWRCLRERIAGVGAGLVALLTVMIQMGLMGGLLTFSPRVLYPVYAERAPQLGLDALADQQLAGLIMWVPACLPYLLGAVWLLARGLGRLDRLQATERHDGAPVYLGRGQRRTGGGTP